MKLFFTDINELAAVVPVMQSLDIALLKPDIDRAQNNFLQPILGKEFLAEFLAEYEEGIDDDTPEAELLEKIQAPIAHLALFYYIDKGNVNIGSSGVQQTHTDGGSKPAFQWAKDEAKQSYFDTGMDGLDILEAFLVEHKADFETWAESSAYAKAKEFFLNTTAEFQNEFNINNSRKTFVAVRHILKRHDNISVKKVLGTELFDEIKQQIFNEEISSANETLLREFIRPALVHHTVADALSELILKINEHGVTVVVAQYAGAQNQSRKPADADQVNQLWKTETTLGKDYLAALKDYLQANAGDYPLYTPTTDYSKQYKNKQDSGLAIL